MVVVAVEVGIKAAVETAGGSLYKLIHISKHPVRSLLVVIVTVEQMLDNTRLIRRYQNAILLALWLSQPHGERILGFTPECNSLANAIFYFITI